MLLNMLQNIPKTTLNLLFIKNKKCAYIEACDAIVCDILLKKSLLK